MAPWMEQGPPQAIVGWYKEEGAAVNTWGAKALWHHPGKLQSHGTWLLGAAGANSRKAGMRWSHNIGRFKRTQVCHIAWLCMRRLPNVKPWRLWRSRRRIRAEHSSSWPVCSIQPPAVTKPVCRQRRLGQWKPSAMLPAVQQTIMTERTPGSIPCRVRSLHQRCPNHVHMSAAVMQALRLYVLLSITRGFPSGGAASRLPSPS
mmetsp:Transcript_17701/g.51666  ORF Transcript_17701/g.51666 Transcript_17701/m.51666 type:complete len:203 (-) Transcript_17701:498-1106(-)